MGLLWLLRSSLTIRKLGTSLFYNPINFSLDYLAEWKLVRWSLNVSLTEDKLIKILELKWRLLVMCGIKTLFDFWGIAWKEPRGIISFLVFSVFGKKNRCSLSKFLYRKFAVNILNFTELPLV
jgi:uncharacterized protein (DUF2062 family)